MAARRAHNPKVVGSSPTPATKTAIKKALGSVRGPFCINLWVALRFEFLSELELDWVRVMPTNKRQFTVILEPELDGGYSVHCPALPGCVSQGDDRKSALANIEEAIILALEEFDDKSSSEFAAAALDAVNGVPFPPDESPDVLLNEIKEIIRAQREDGVPVRMEIEQVELNSPVSA